MSSLPARISAGVTIFLALTCAEVVAAIVKFEFNGTVTRVDGAPANVEANISVGSSMSGLVIFDTSTTDLQATDPEVGEYDFLSPPAGVTFFFLGNTLSQSPENVRLQVRARVFSDGTYDQQVYTVSSGGLDQLFGWTPDAMVWGLANSTTSVLLSDAIPISLNLAEWGKGSWRVTGGATVISGTIDSLSQIPEPATVTLFGLGLALVSIGALRRVALAA